MNNLREELQPLMTSKIVNKYKSTRVTLMDSDEISKAQIDQEKQPGSSQNETIAVDINVIHDPSY